VLSIDDDDEYAELFKKLPSGSSSGTSWQDVASELGALGDTLGNLVRAAWQQSDGDALLSGLRESLSSVADDVNRAAEGSPETQRARDELTRLIESIRAAAAQAGEEIRPELLTLLREANAQLRRLGKIDD
jgi:ABC-type transporter Mla subunit MlaD